MSRVLLLCVIACAVPGLMIACRRPDLPDVIPLQTVSGYCDIVPSASGSRLLRIVMKNQGSGFIGQALITRITFPARQTFAGQVVDRDVPAGSLGPGGQYEHLIPLPAGGFDPDLVFTITVDAANAVPESDENNNSVDGVCVG
jgi:hypothetical protein